MLKITWLLIWKRKNFITLSILQNIYFLNIFMGVLNNFLKVLVDGICKNALLIVAAGERYIFVINMWSSCMWMWPTWGAGIGLFGEINHPSTPWECGCASTWQLSFLPHHHYIKTGHTYLIPLNTINMTPPKPLVQNPVDIPFENGIILTTTINPITCRHSIQCDLCEVIIDLGISASGSTIWKHRDHEPYRRTAHKLRTQRAREHIKVCVPRL